MRSFNKREQDIIRKLVEYYKDRDNLNTIGLFLTEKIVGDDFKMFIREDELYIVYCKDDDKKNVLYKVVEILNLFRKLIDNHLIVIMPGTIEGLLIIGDTAEAKIEKQSGKVISFENGDYIKQNDSYWYDKNGQLKYVCFSFTERQYKIKDFIASVPIISPELEILVENKFKTIEEKTLRVTRFAAVISFGAFVFAIMLPFVSRTKINKEQYEEFVNSMQTIEQKVSNSANQISNAIDSLTYKIKDKLQLIEQESTEKQKNLIER